MYTAYKQCTLYLIAMKAQILLLIKRSKMKDEKLVSNKPFLRDFSKTLIVY